MGGGRREGGREGAVPPAAPTRLFQGTGAERGRGEAKGGPFLDKVSLPTAAEPGGRGRVVSKSPLPPKWSTEEEVREERRGRTGWIAAPSLPWRGRRCPAGRRIRTGPPPTGSEWPWQSWAVSYGSLAPAESTDLPSAPPPSLETALGIPRACLRGAPSSGGPTLSLGPGASREPVPGSKGEGRAAGQLFLDWGEAGQKGFPGHLPGFLLCWEPEGGRGGCSGRTAGRQAGSLSSWRRAASQGRPLSGSAPGWTQALGAGGGRRGGGAESRGGPFG